MSVEIIEKQAYKYFSDGHTCSEAVFKAIVEKYDDNFDDSLARMATGFLGGIGGSYDEACGALTGGILALGYLYGRTDPEENLDTIKELSQKFKACFIEANGATKCGVFLERFGEAKAHERCMMLTSKTAGLLAQILADHNGE